VIDSVILWNEPNNLSHWDRSLDPDWSLFSEMIALAGERLGELAPGLPRVLGGISPMDAGFVRRLFQAGLDRAIDVVAVHGFPLDWNRWHLRDWPSRIADIRAAANGKPIWATEVGASSIVSSQLQAWAVDAILDQVVPSAERTYWYALTDLPESWEAVTRHRASEGSAYYRHFRMGVYDAQGQPKPAADRLTAWVGRGVGVVEWIYWQEPARFAQSVRLLRDLGVTRVRTGIGWADWERPGAASWFDHVMSTLAPFDVALTLCFTPAARGRGGHHTSPPHRLADFADFCATIVSRYGSHTCAEAQVTHLLPRDGSRTVTTKNVTRD
jgi:beta-xylosidase